MSIRWNVFFTTIDPPVDEHDQLEEDSKQAEDIATSALVFSLFDGIGVVAIAVYLFITHKKSYVALAT